MHKIMNFMFVRITVKDRELLGNLISWGNINNFLWCMHDARLITCNVIFIT